MGLNCTVSIKRYIEKIEMTEDLTLKSKLTLDDVEEISNEITKRSWEKHKEYLRNLKK